MIPVSVELTFAAILLALWLLQRSRIASLAERPRMAGALIFTLPVILRLVLLVRYPVPSPAVSDDFAQLLSADTLLHLRLANPVHPMHRFFETFFTLQEPAYAAMFPLGQGIILALGKLLTGTFWGGVAISSGLLAAGCYWMLRGWVAARWALLGGVLTGIQFGPLCEWMNSFWGGNVAAFAGCLVFGALPRCKTNPSRKNALILGAGLALHLITRPYESIFLFASAGIYLAASRCKPWFAVGPVGAALVLILFQNHAVTGQWTKLPLQLSQEQYGVPSTFTFFTPPEPKRELTREQELAVEIQKQRHPTEESPSFYFQRLAYRFRYLRFYFLAPVYLAIPFFLPSLRKPRYFWAFGTIGLFILGSNFYPYFYPQYIAAVTCLFVLLAVRGLENMYHWSAQGALWVSHLTMAHFLFWFGALLFASTPALDALKPFATWHVINMGDPESRIAVRKEMEAQPGKQLVFVRYFPMHTFREWVHNSADIDRQKVIWARDLGGENTSLRNYYPDRKAWLLEPDARPPRLRPLD